MSELVLKNLQPAEVFKYFEEIISIPRGSGNEKAISDYLVSFAKENNLEYIQDKALNVIIKKEASKGYEGSKPVILQGHIDMVCEKNKDTQHDFTKDPIIPVIKDDFVYAKGTTLGADNGIAVAMTLAILASKEIKHPAIEALFTTEEETGMGGAQALSKEYIKGRSLINIDSEEEGQLLVSCAGGVRNQIILPINYDHAPKGYSTFELTIRGLKGGHSGMEIDKGRANANKLMGRVLEALLIKTEILLSSINGGSKNNAIPREMDVIFAVPSEDEEILHSEINNWQEIFQNEFRNSDKGIILNLTKLNNEVKVITNSQTEKAIKLLYMIPNGIETMSMAIKGLVESSTNLGVVTTAEESIIYDSAIRSSVLSLRNEILEKTTLVAITFGASISTQSAYPEWQYNENSPLRDVFISTYKDMYGKDPEIVAIHAGVECGLFKEKFGDIDMISFGPNLFDVHTPDEHLSISSVKRSYEYLLKVLENIK